MIDQPHIDPYSTPARNCLGVAILSVVLLIAAVVMQTLSCRKAASVGCLISCWLTSSAWSNPALRRGERPCKT